MSANTQRDPCNQLLDIARHLDGAKRNNLLCVRVQEMPRQVEEDAQKLEMQQWQVRQIAIDAARNHFCKLQDAAAPALVPLHILADQVAAERSEGSDARSEKIVSAFYKRCDQVILSVVGFDDGLALGTNGKRVGEGMAVTIWLQQNASNLWGAFLGALKRRREIPERQHGQSVQMEQPQYAVLQRHQEIRIFQTEQTWDVLVRSRVGLYDSHVGVGMDALQEQGTPYQMKRLQHFSHAAVSSAAATGVELPQQQHLMHQKLKPEPRRDVEMVANAGAAANIKRNRQNGTPENSMSKHIQPKASRKRPKTTQSIPTFVEICCIIPSEDEAIKFLLSKGIFTDPKDTICSHCGYQGFRQKGRTAPKSMKCNRCSKGRSLMKAHSSRACARHCTGFSTWQSFGWRRLRARLWFPSCVVPAPPSQNWPTDLDGSSSVTAHLKWCAQQRKSNARRERGRNGSGES